MKKQYYIYILTNKTNNVLYTGFTEDLIKRVAQHRQELIEGFTKKYHVHKLVFYEICNDPLTGITREKTIKNMVRRKKLALIEKFNPEWKDLYHVIMERSDAK